MTNKCFDNKWTFYTINFSLKYEVKIAIMHYTYNALYV